MQTCWNKLFRLGLRQKYAKVFEETKKGGTQTSVVKEAGAIWFEIFHEFTQNNILNFKAVTNQNLDLVLSYLLVNIIKSEQIEAENALKK